tara:strand:- start:351 stop:656 length:306 start_codon:yes stop_codon:yes gene_type:complete
MFFQTDYSKCDQVSFYIRNDFSDYLDSSNVLLNFKNILNKLDIEEREIDIKNITHFIKRGDTTAQRYYIKNYMDTTIKNKRPDTPAKLIIDPIPKDYIPDY